MKFSCLFGDCGFVDWDQRGSSLDEQRATGQNSGSSSNGTIDVSQTAGEAGPRNLLVVSQPSLTLYVPIIAILNIWKTTLFNEGESVVYDGFKYVWPVKG